VPPLTHILTDKAARPAFAVREGIVPVLPARRFLSNWTNTGLFWLPGMKFRHQHGDVDLLACCDGRLVFCECKTTPVVVGAGLPRLASRPWIETDFRDRVVGSFKVPQLQG
jgi:hypothetical protein